MLKVSIGFQQVAIKNIQLELKTFHSLIKIDLICTYLSTATSLFI